MNAQEVSLKPCIDASLSPNKYLQNAKLIHPELAVNQAISTLADSLKQAYLNDTPIVLCVMSGGVYFTGQLLPKLKFSLELDYVHATRYDATIGKKVKWLATPKILIKNRNILILDDILDEGITLKAIVDECLKLGAKQINIAVLVEKTLDKDKPIKADYVGLTVPNQFVFGCGMDISGWWRNLPEIYAVSDTQVFEKNN